MQNHKRKLCSVSNMWSFILFAVFVANEFGESVPLSKNDGGMIPMVEGRVIGGNYAPITSVPWTCSQQHLGAHRCGCAIISPTVTLTAANCASHIPGNGFHIRAGSDSKNRDGQLIPTREVVIHPSFNEAILEHNICVMFLALPLNTAVPGVSVISMVAGGFSPAPDAPSSVSGWGPMYENGIGSEILRSVTHPIYTMYDCVVRHGSRITHDMMCAGLDAGGAAACDPGSPLVSGGALIGIMSWSEGCGRPLLPSVYSRISSARFWIDFVINSDASRSN